MILKRFFNRTPRPERVAYEAIVAAARHEAFYADWHVPDTLDGRFDMITLHAFLALDRLKGVEERFRQQLVDELFRDMDRSLREMGVGDLAVGKKVRKMAEVFYGRIAAYDQALAAGEDAMTAAISRNIFADGTQDGAAGMLAGYVFEAKRFLDGQAVSSIAAGQIAFREPAP